jgi:hypothetical protein
MGACPITCKCRRGGEGVFLLAACVFAANWSPVFLGADFGELVAGLLYPPHALPLVLAVWLSVASAGLSLTIIGIRALLREGDSAPALPSLAAMSVSAVAMGWGWYLPREWGAVWSLGSEGFYLAVIAAGAANLCIAAASQVWMAGYIAAGGDYIPRRAPGDLGEYRQIIERQAREIDSLIAERDRLTGDLAHASASVPDLQVVLLFPGVRTAVLKALHPDAHPGASDRERRAWTERFQKAAAVFDRLGAAR